MKVAVVYNKDTRWTVNVFGQQNREWYPEATIQKVVQSLEKTGNEVQLIPVDRHLLPALKKFLPKLSKRQHPGIVFNLALGLQGKCRYTHVPALLETSGIPYTGSSPLGHTLSLDKVVTKHILRAAGLPTPRSVVMMHPDQPVSELQFPVIVKPRGEAASFGLNIVEKEEELKTAVEAVQKEFKQSVLVEEYIDGREVNVSLLGNGPPEPLPVLELMLGESDRKIYDQQVKFAHGKQAIKRVCPAPLPEETVALLQHIAVRAFEALNIYDYGRVDIRLDRFLRPYILEMNSMASINPTSSFVKAAQVAGYSYGRLMNRIIDAAVERYAGEEPEFFRKAEYQNTVKANEKIINHEPERKL